MKDIFKFVYAGRLPLSEHNFVATKLNKQKCAARPMLMAELAEGDDFAESTGDSEADIKFRLNATGNIFTSTTSEDGQVSDEAKALFKSVTVLFSAMTKAMHDAEKSLFDYDTWVDLIGKTGYFIEMQKFQ